MTEQLEWRTLIAVFWGGRFRGYIKPEDAGECLKTIRAEYPEVAEVDFRAMVGRTGKGDLMGFLTEDQEEQIKADLRAQVAIWSARENLSAGELLVVAELVRAADGEEAAAPHYERAAAAGDKSAIAHLAETSDSCAWCEMECFEGAEVVVIPVLTVSGSQRVTRWHPECYVRSCVGSPAHLRRHCSTRCCGDGSEDGPAPQAPEWRRAEAFESWLIVKGLGDS